MVWVMGSTSELCNHIIRPRVLTLYMAALIKTYSFQALVHLCLLPSGARKTHKYLHSHRCLPQKDSGITWLLAKRNAILHDECDWGQQSRTAVSEEEGFSWGKSAMGLGRIPAHSVGALWWAVQAPMEPTKN